MSKPGKLSPSLLNQLEVRLRRHIAKKWPDVKDFRIRARGDFVYIDVLCEEDPQEFEPVCRLGFLGSLETWEFAYFSWSRGSRGGYEMSVLDNGSPLGSAEECFDCAYQPAGAF